MGRTFSMHPREPYQSTDRHPYASHHVVKGSDGPFVTLTIGDHTGDEVVIFVRSEITLKRIEEAVASARFALRNSRPLRVDMDSSGKDAID